MFKSAAKFIAKAAIASAIFVLFFKIAFVHTCGACGGLLPLTLGKLKIKKVNL